MIEFKDITLADKDLIQSFTLGSLRRNCDLSFANLCSWIFLYQTKYAVMDNYLLLRFYAGEEFSLFELPLLVGISRKSMIYKLLGGTPDDALNGTTVLDTISLLKGADILRVHDVKAAVETVKIVQKMKNSAAF